MDPNATLQKLRDLASKIGRDEASEDEVTEFAMSFGDLDMWLANGGFIPADWRPF